MIWLFGLPCSGKTTLAWALEKEIARHNKKALVLDGDDLRQTVSSDLGFSMEDRFTHIKRTVTYAASQKDQQKVVIASLITPLEKYRRYIKEQLPETLLVYLKCHIDICKKRDVKGMYKQAKEKKIANFTGVSHPFEEPKKVSLTLNTAEETVSECIKKISHHIKIETL